MTLKETEKPDQKTETLNKYLADCGVCSRRKAAELIKAGLVSINNKVITVPSHRLNADDVVRYKKKVVKPENKVYILLNKPAGYITTRTDPYERKTVMDLVKAATNKRLYPVGRLDKETTGLLLLSNDGDMTQKLSHPRHKIAKVYHTILDQPISEKDLAAVRRGVKLLDGIIKADRVYYVRGKNKKHIGVQIHSGKNRIVRRIFKCLGYNVTKLNRVGYGGLTTKGVAVGHWRYLTKKEVFELQA